MKTKEYIPLCYDLLFKKMFGSNEEIGRLENLLSLYFNIPIEELKGRVRVINNEKLINQKNEKRQTFDILAKVELINNKEKINIEINLSNSVGLLNRNIVYISHIFSSQSKNKENYLEIEPVIQINFDDFEIDENNQAIIKKYYIQSDTGHKLTHNLQIYHINIEKCKNIWYNEDINKYSKEEQRIIIFGSLMKAKNKDEFNKCLEALDMEEFVKENIGQTMEDLNSDEELLLFFDKDKIIKSELAENFEKGIKQGKIEIAKNMLSKKIDEKTISEITGLTLKELDLLK